eukprot:scaffold25682_cov131-Isochrysis_galbana.AAC.1
MFRVAVSLSLWLNINKKALHLAATRWDTSVPCRPDTPPPLSHSSPILLLLQAAFCGGWFQGCVHYNSLGKSIESLGSSVVPYPMSALVSTSLRADYGRAFTKRSSRRFWGNRDEEGPTEHLASTYVAIVTPHSGTITDHKSLTGLSHVQTNKDKGANSITYYVKGKRPYPCLGSR